MSNFSLFPQDAVLTTAGRQAVLLSMTPDYDLDIYRASLGDQPMSGGALEDSAGVQNEVLTMMLQAENQRAENGHLWLHYWVEQAQTLQGETSFMLAELAIMAHLIYKPTGAVEDVCLIANNAFGFAREIHLSEAQTIQTLEWEFMIPISGDPNIIISVGPTPIYVTPAMAHSYIRAHNDDPLAHNGVIQEHALSPLGPETHPGTHALLLWLLQRIEEGSSQHFTTDFDELTDWEPESGFYDPEIHALVTTY